MTIIPCIPQRMRRASQRKAVYGHDHLPFPFQKKMTNQELIWGLFVKKKGLSIYCQSCKAWAGWANVNQTAQPSFMEMDNNGQCAHYNSSIRRTHHPFPSQKKRRTSKEEGSV